MQLIDCVDMCWDDAQHHGDAATLLEEVAAEPAQASHTVSHIELCVLLELLLLAIGHHPESNTKRILSGQALGFDQRNQLAVDPHIGIVPDFQVQVGSFAVARHSQEFVNAEAHGSSI